MAKFIQTQLIDAEPALLVTTPAGDQDIYTYDEPIPDGCEIRRGIIVKTGYADENGEHYQWISEEMYNQYGLIKVQHNSDMPTNAPSVSSEMVDKAIVSTETKTMGDKTTIVRATLWNGFEIIEASSCVSPENYNEYVGEASCLTKIRDKVWMLLGFLLQTAVSSEKVDAECL